MNREILFRGKRVDNGEWVYGAYGNHTSLDAMIIDRPYPTSGGDLSAIGFWVVDPSTVGQYTGLTDKNERKIFDGDIINACEDGEDYIYTVRWCGGAYPAFDVKPDIDCDSNGLSYLYWFGAGIEVIGNIHDNQEMVGGADSVS